MEMNHAAADNRLAQHHHKYKAKQHYSNRRAACPVY